jgi:hypothetical protein
MLLRASGCFPVLQDVVFLETVKRKQVTVYKFSCKVMGFFYRRGTRVPSFEGSAGRIYEAL